MIILSKHAADETEKRKITLAYIEAAISEPEWTATDAVDNALTRSFKRIPEYGLRVLRVVHRPHLIADTFVVTAHWDRGAKP